MVLYEHDTARPSFCVMFFTTCHHNSEGISALHVFEIHICRYVHIYLRQYVYIYIHLGWVKTPGGNFCSVLEPDA